MSFLELMAGSRAELARVILQHLLLVAVATAGATAIGVPTGILLTRRPRLQRPVLGVANILQTVPSLALFGFLIPILGAYGIGRAPALIALFLYALLPIIRNTMTGVLGVDAAVREAGRGMGMTDGQLLRQVELPLALPVITAGVRTATVISIGTATIAAAIGAGGLGTYIFRGLRMNDNGLILAGALPAAAMAIAADLLLGAVERALAPGTASRRRRIRAAGTAIAVALAAIVALVIVAGSGGAVGAPGAGGPAAPAARGRVVVGSKDFTEQVILGEIIAQALEQRGLEVERRFELGGDLCHRGLVAGEIDVYVEYTGTALTAILKQPPLTSPREVYAIVRREYPARFGAEWAEPLGFENTFAILVRGAEARRLGLTTISSAAPHTRGWRAAFGQDFMSREDGYPGLSRAYGLSFAEAPREMDLALTYRALAGGQVNLIAGNSTDGLIEKLDLTQLEDDRHYFPPYEAAPVVRRAVAERYPAVGEALRRLAGKITTVKMRRYNLAVDGEHRQPRDVAAEALKELGP